MFFLFSGCNQLTLGKHVVEGTELGIDFRLFCLVKSTFKLKVTVVDLT